MEHAIHVTLMRVAFVLLLRAHMRPPPSILGLINAGHLILTINSSTFRSVFSPTLSSVKEMNISPLQDHSKLSYFTNPSPSLMLIVPSIA